jgi:hypothetical protein
VDTESTISAPILSHVSRKVIQRLKGKKKERHLWEEVFAVFLSPRGMEH